MSCHSNYWHGVILLMNITSFLSVRYLCITTVPICSTSQVDVVTKSQYFFNIILYVIMFLVSTSVHESRTILVR